MMTTDPAKVADALPDSWVYRLLPHSVWPYAQLARWERPIGWWLLLWPCWWSLALAVSALTESARTFFRLPSNAGTHNVRLVCSMCLKSVSPLMFGFTSALVPLMLGAILMRGAGCTYNDID